MFNVRDFGFAAFLMLKGYEPTFELNLIYFSLNIERLKELEKEFKSSDYYKYNVNLKKLLKVYRSTR